VCVCVCVCVYVCVFLCVCVFSICVCMCGVLMCVCVSLCEATIMCHDSIIDFPRLIRLCAMTQAYTCHDFRATGVVLRGNIYVRHDSFICAP